MVDDTQERRGFSLRLFLGAIVGALVGIFVLGAAARLVPVGPIARLGLVGLVVVGVAAFAAARKRWDIAIGVGATVLGLSVFFVWLASKVVGNID